LKFFASLLLRSLHTADLMSLSFNVHFQLGMLTKVSFRIEGQGALPVGLSSYFSKTSVDSIFHHLFHSFM